MTTDVQRYRQSRMRLPRRTFDSGDGDVINTDADLGRAVTLAEFARRNSLPSVVRVVRGRFADIGCGPDDAHAEIYVHSTSSIATTADVTGRGASGHCDVKATVFAQVMRFADDAELNKQLSAAWRSSHRYGNRGLATSGPAAGRRLVATGRTVCLPEDGIEVAGCWFELLSEDGRAAPALRSVEELANRALRPVPQIGDAPAAAASTTRYLVRQTVFASVGSISSATLTIQPGETLTPLKVVASAQDIGDHHRQRLRLVDCQHLSLQCVDGRFRTLFLPFAQQGLFSPVAECSDGFPDMTQISGVGVVYDGIKSVISSCRLPVTVRIAAGRLSIPDSVGVSSGSTAPIFRLTGVSRLNTSDDVTHAAYPKKTQHVDDENRTVYVMSLRHAWSTDAVTSSTTAEDDDWRSRLIAVPLSAARSLDVVAASRDFHVSWLTTDDGRELARRCDRIIAGRRSTISGGRISRHKTLVDERNEDDYEIHVDGRDHHRRNAPRRQTSIDSGLASSALNDDLYDEIDHIYCMIRYGPDARPIIVEPPPEATRRQRAKSYEDGGGFQVGCRLEAGMGGYVPRGVAAVLNERRSPELGNRMSGFEPITWSYSARRPGDTVTTARHGPPPTSAGVSRSRANANTNDRTQPQQSLRPNLSRPSSRCAGDVIASSTIGENRRPDCDGRSESGWRSRKSSAIVIALDDEDSDVARDVLDSRDKHLSTDGRGLLSPSAVVYCTSHVGGGVSDADRESGNATAADATTTSGESPALQRKYFRRKSAHDTAAMSTDVATPGSDNMVTEPTRMGTGRGRRSLSANGLRPRNSSADLTDANHAQATDNDIPSPHLEATPNENGDGGKQSRKPALVTVISQSLANAFRRVGKRSTGTATFGGAEGEFGTAHDATTVKSTGDAQSRKKRHGVKSGRKDRKASTWYHSDVAAAAAAAAAAADDNNNSNRVAEDGDDDDDLEVFDYDIGDGRPNVDFSRELYTARNRRSLVEADAAKPSQRRRGKATDPPLLLASRSGGGSSTVANGRAKRPKSPTALFEGHRGMRGAVGRHDDLSTYIGGQYKNIGQY